MATTVQVPRPPLITFRWPLTGARYALCPGIVPLLEKGSFDVIVLGAYNTPTAMLAISSLNARGRPFVINADGGFPADESLVRRTVKRRLISSATAWLSTGDFTDDYLKFYGARQENIYRYSFSSIFESDIAEEPASSEEKRALRETLGVTDDRIVLTVGQFIPRKRIDVLLKAAQEFQDPDVGLYIVGGTPPKEYFDMIQALGLKSVHFRPWIGKEELRRFYRSAEVVAFPTREDIWGLVVNGAMAAGTPVVTTDRCGSGLEMISPGVEGDRVPVGDSHQLAAAISRVLNSDRLRGAMAAASLRKARQFTIEQMARDHLAAFERLGELGTSRLSDDDRRP